MMKKRLRFIVSETADMLGEPMEKRLFVIWNALSLLLSSAALCAVSLIFAIGEMPLFYIYLGYFKTPLIFLLNWLPILFLQILLYALLRRQWIAFLLNSILTLLPALGNYFKLKFRNDPFTFDDLSSIRAGLGVAGDYDISFNRKIWLALAFVVAGTLILLLLARGRFGIRVRLISVLLVLAAIWPLWTLVYSNGDLYYRNYERNYMWLAKDDRDNFIATGFPYPFLYSITQSANTQPENYDEKATAELFDRYEGEPIPEERRINLLAIQLESFCDLEAAGVTGIQPEVYASFRQLTEESWSGTIIANVIGGGTINTERAFVTGNFRQMDYHGAAFSYVRYLSGQGYDCYATHPNAGHFYTRSVTDRDLGFSEFYGLDNYFQDITGGEIQCDDSYLPEIFRMFRERVAEGKKPVFAFNVSWQGHGPYGEAAVEYGDGEYWSLEGASKETYFVLNNYFALMAETQEILWKEIQSLRDIDEPVVVIVFGDHKPLFSEQVYAELGIEASMENRQAMENFLGAPYLIWANRTAEECLGDVIRGEGPTISPCYLMNLLFEKLGWGGPAYMHFTNEVKEHLPVICTRGAYLEDDVFTHKLSEKGENLTHQYACLQYFLRYRPELSR